jgi:hypothetical protein
MNQRDQLTAPNFPSAEQDAQAAAPPLRYDGPDSSYQLAFTDTDFLLQPALRPVRMQLELHKASRARWSSSAAPASRRPTLQSNGWRQRVRLATRPPSGAPRRSWP